MALALPAHVPASLAGLLRRDGDWLRCAEPNCGDRAFWGIFRDGDFLRVKVGQHRAKMHNGARPPRPQAGRPQRRAAAAPAQGAQVPADMLAALLGRRLGAGVARVGFDLRQDSLILKRAHPGQERHNLAEWASYNAAPASVRKYLCPLLACAPDGSWLLARKAEIGNVRQAHVAELRSALARHGVQDLHLGNIGYVDGQVVATDYAQGMDGSVIRWAR